MTTKEISKYYKIHESITYKNMYCLYSLIEEAQRSNGGKYLCAIKKEDGYFSLNGIKCRTIEELNKTVKEYLSTLEFNSENYNVDLRKGITEELCICDYMGNLGFKTYYACSSYGTVDFKYSKNDVFGQPVNISISVSGLSDGEANKVKIYLNTNSNGTYLGGEVEKETYAVINAINNLIYPLLVGNIANMILSLEQIKIKDFKGVYGKIQLTNTGITVENYKQELKNKLQEILDQLN